MVRKEKICNIDSVLPERIDLFICTASFEQRCLSIAEQVSSRVGHALVILNSEYRDQSAANSSRLFPMFLGKVTEIQASLELPTSTANAFNAGIMPELANVKNGNVLIDITTFTHEQLLILLGLLKANPPHAKLTMGYTGAKEYSVNTNEDNVWLSRGVRQVRSVLGYAGQFAPSKRLHLMILAGFESERAQALIETMEPARLSLGTNDINHSVAPQHYARNERFSSRLTSFVERQQRVGTEIDTFSFSCVDPFSARDAILRQAEKYDGFNTVLCPMNTKISTIGAGLAVFSRERIQIVYALPAEYNESGYSTSGDSVTLFDLPLT